MNSVECVAPQDTLRLGLFYGGLPNCGKSPPPGPLVRGAERGVSNRGRQAHETLPRNRFPLPLSPRSTYEVRMLTLVRAPKGAVTPKLTMIAGAGNFPSGNSRCEAPFSI